ncbi:MAG: c-type cytochrome [Mariprofundaceae bacterium]|nr:c-type cytochrome [Mariprofundaceae bacterium]
MFKIVTIFVSLMVLSSSAWAADMQGKALFNNNCASCHAMDGKGSKMGLKLKPFPARDLTALAATVQRDELRRIISGGIQGTAMTPKKYDLDALEIEYVIDYILGFKRTVNLANGKKRFSKVCVSCHGMDGRSQTGMGAKNLVYSKLSLADTVHTIRYGRAGTKMTSKRHQLNNADIEDVANYVHGLRYQHNLKKGAELYASTCKSCHKSPSTIKLQGNAAAKKSMSDLSDYVLDLRIRHGRHVARSNKQVQHLSDDDTRDIIAYLRQETK